MIKVLVVDDNTQGTAHLVNELKEFNEFEVVGTAEDGLRAISLIEKLNPDVVLLDLIMPQLDGFGVLEEAKRQNYNCKFIVVSAVGHDAFIHKAIMLGASYYMMKPYDSSLLKTRIAEVAFGQRALTQNNAGAAVANDRAAESVKTRFNRSLEEKITNIFITVGIPAHIKGYQFLREAIKMAIDSPEIINSITKKLYPSIADRFDTTASKVERAIRHAIEVAWNRGKIENINALFGVRVYGNNEKPTNGEFIALVADKMLIEGA